MASSDTSCAAEALGKVLLQEDLATEAKIPTPEHQGRHAMDWVVPKQAVS